MLTAAKLSSACPSSGSLTLLLFAILIFVLALVILGYTFFDHRADADAGDAAHFLLLSAVDPAVRFMFPFGGMPLWAQYLGEIFPITHFLRIVRAIMLKGADWNAVSFESRS